ncbi:unnamed protein product [Caenorhabditis sp. 36 PRJEB53466]|nr:unnamed protein product [Caenorhabditis sp. 36 PRJEB53466]
MLRYFVSLLKQLFNGKPTKLQTVTNESWKDVLKKENSYRERRRMKAAVYPSNRVLIRKILNDKEASKKKRANDGFFLQFVVDCELSNILVTTQKNFGDSMIEKVFPKMSAAAEDRILMELGTIERITVKAAATSAPLDPSVTFKEYVDNKNHTSVLINNFEYKVIRDSNPIHLCMLQLLPIIDYFCMSKIDFTIEGTPVKLHWFVKDDVFVAPKVKPDKRKKQDNVKLNCKFVDEQERKFAIEGYTYRSTHPYFVAKARDLDRLVAVIVDGGIDYPVVAASSTRAVCRGPDSLLTDDQVQWCRENKLSKNGDVIRAMTYNLLADIYLNLDNDSIVPWFPHCPKDFQRIFYRSPLLLKQLHEFSDGHVSLWFLQEVDAHRYKNHINPLFKHMGFTSIFSKKTNNNSEGVVLSFDNSLFELVREETFVIKDLALEENNADLRDLMEQSKTTKDRFMSRPTVLQVVVIREKRSGTIVVCANTHLHHQPKEEHLKVMQTTACIRKVTEVYEKQKAENSNVKVRVLFGGDFNTLPNKASYNILSTGTFPSDDEVWSCDENLTGTELKIKQPMDCLSGVFEYTNYTKDEAGNGFSGCLDYIWGIDVSTVRVCPMPPHEKVTKYTALPSEISPSDHLPVIVDLKL